MEAVSHYETLGIRPDVRHRDIVRAFARLAEQYQKAGI
jgi:curved DNA-binding protein CbpA